MDSNVDDLKNILEKLEINIKEFNKIGKIVDSIKNDKEIKNIDKVKIFVNINNIFSDEKIDNEIKIKKNNKKYINKDKIVKSSCKKCGKNKFKKYDFCYKHCQEENIIPKHIKRKDFDEYKKSL